MEKEQATPEYYPLTVNALIAACNQKSNRDPVVQLSETEVVEALDSLAVDTLVWRSDGARAERWRQSISRRLELDAEEKALLTVLLLRGPQTVGELRSRSTRLHKFDSPSEIEAALERLTAEGRELVAELARRPGQKENRWAQLLSGPVEEAASPAPRLSPAPASPASRMSNSRSDELADRVTRLEEALAKLAVEVERLGRADDSEV